MDVDRPGGGSSSDPRDSPVGPSALGDAADVKPERADSGDEADDIAGDPADGGVEAAAVGDNGNPADDIGSVQRLINRRRGKMKACRQCYRVETWDGTFGCPNGCFDATERRADFEQNVTGPVKGLIAVIDPHSSWLARYLFTGVPRPGVYAHQIDRPQGDDPLDDDDDSDVGGGGFFRSGGAADGGDDDADADSLISGGNEADTAGWERMSEPDEDDRRRRREKKEKKKEKKQRKRDKGASSAAAAAADSDASGGGRDAGKKKSRGGADTTGGDAALEFTG
eukprot:TRINITY_DN2680_c0_g1_i1.p1 TRINITY_DN2680_c0_g1~~TRINITY_DN2680_c0_g1_i1.p1  ORF type:complete len:282 (+),score=78.21 TRINITY_DN2680_c0_g1_i1:139-984(+)